MGWYNLTVMTLNSTGVGYVVTVRGWDLADAISRARSAGYVVLAQSVTPSTASTTQII